MPSIEHLKKARKSPGYTGHSLKQCQGMGRVQSQKDLGSEGLAPAPVFLHAVVLNGLPADYITIRVSSGMARGGVAEGKARGEAQSAMLSPARPFSPIPRAGQVRDRY